MVYKAKNAANLKDCIPEMKHVLCLFLQIVYAFTLGTTDAFASRPADLNENCLPEKSQVQKSQASNGTDDWIVSCSTKAVPELFRNNFFKTGSIVKSSVKFGPAALQSDLRKEYEEIWCQDGKAVGIEKRAVLDIPRNQNVAIEILIQGCPSLAENKGSANAIMRLLLDLILNHDKVSAVRVSPAAFSGISQELQNRCLRVAIPGQNPPQEAKLVFQLSSSDGRMQETMYFQ